VVVEGIFSEGINNNELRATKPGPDDEQKLQELKSVLDLHLIRLVKLLFHDLANIDHIHEITDNKLNHTICNIADNNDKFIPDLVKDYDEWLHLKLNSNSYYLGVTDGLQEDNNALYCIICHKTHKHIIFMRAPSKEFKFKTIAMHHLYISDDDELGRYKVQTKHGDISKQFFVPANYVMDRYNKFIRLFYDIKKLEYTSDAVYSRQTR
jgi:hypothetical protein